MANFKEPFGLPFFRGSKEQTRRHVLSLAEQKKGGSVVFANAHVVVEASQNDSFKTILSESTVIVPDGVPVSWLLKLLGAPQTERYSGPDFMEDLFEVTPTSKHFFLGSTPEVLNSIKERFKGQAAGFYSPPKVASSFSKEEISKQLEMIRNAAPDYIWVGLGAPKQEKYVVEMAKLWPHSIWLAVGAAFDFYAGNKPRAPKALQRLGMEWAFRAATEPRRLFMRYLKTNPVFIKLALSELLRKGYSHG
jgi:exopolysaccharide biosynthesis WecB/TagA/CpsF family protein